MTTIGSLFSGYGGLDMAVEAFFDAQVRWYSEIEPAACTVLAARYPYRSNLGDITKVDWSQVAPIDILTGGYPCQPFSHAGKRKGKNDERHLWPYVLNAISALGPRYAILENVYGHLSLGLADVLADLADVGYDARWGVVRASDAGAPHQRARIFIAAKPNRAGHGPWQDARGMGSLEADAAGETPQWQRAWGIAGASSFDDELRERESSPSDADSAGLQGHDSLSGSSPSKGCGHVEPCACIPWGKYGPAIRRWERLTRPSPVPTVLGRNGRPRLNPAFVEWLMGLPKGHVTGHGLRTAQELKMLGNGVVPQQAALALSLLLGNSNALPISQEGAA